MKKIAVKYQIDNFSDHISGVFVGATAFDKDGEVTRWMVRHHVDRMNREGWFSYEPLPSARDDKYLKDHSFDTLDEAIEIYNKYKRVKFPKREIFS